MQPDQRPQLATSERALRQLAQFENSNREDWTQVLDAAARGYLHPNATPEFKARAMRLIGRAILGIQVWDH